jgi:hypothetical protein
MPKYCYFPILKTRPSEVNAYNVLNYSVKDEILPIIEMTGEIGRRYSENNKNENLRGKYRAGDINKKVQKILDFMGQRRFILDITDDDSLKHDGLSSREGGLLDSKNGYESWRNFLSQNINFKKQVIPTIQSTDMNEVETQIKELDKNFDYMAIKLPAFTKDNLYNNPIPQIIDWIYRLINKPKLFLILDFDYVNSFNPQTIQNWLPNIDTVKLKALIPVSSSFPNSVSNTKQKPIIMHENKISDYVKSTLDVKNIYHGDYSSIHPTRYEMGGAGWLARIDYIVRDEASKRPVSYNYARGEGKNNSLEYLKLATQVISAHDYSAVKEISTYGDQRISAKANGGIEGKAPSYWITVRSNLYMTMQYLYLKKLGSFLTL